MSKIGKFASELLRRKVVRLLGAYIAVFWLLAQGFASLFPVLGVPDWALRAFIAIGVAAIPVLAFFSWKYDIVPPQLVRDSKDIELENPALSWASVRHDNRDAGHILLRWHDQSGGQMEKRFFRPVAIGREASNDIELADDRVSRHHAVIWAESGAWRLRDWNSANGSFIDHVRVAAPIDLPQSCELRFHPNGPTVTVHIAKMAETVVG